MVVTGKLLIIVMLMTDINSNKKIYNVTNAWTPKLLSITHWLHN